MSAFEQFEQDLHEGLANLYNPAYRPPPSLVDALDREAPQDVAWLQTRLIEVIEALRPPETAPPTSESHRIYRVLHHRYVEGLTQKETAQRLGITSRHLRREQQRAIHVLAQRLWRQRTRQGQADKSLVSADAPAAQSAPTAPDRLSQIRRELKVLEESAPGALADVETAIRAALKSGKALGARHGVTLRVEHIEPGLITTLHPAVLREVLITVVDRLVHAASPGEITFRAERRAEQIRITTTGRPTAVERPEQSLFIQEAVTAQGGSVDVHREHDRTIFAITLPAAEKIKVLVLEDNEDLVHFYRRYATGTRYEIVHVPGGDDTLQTVLDVAPDVIMLDILLPDVDGWELLNQLHEHPDTASTPVIVCSVVRREELSLALGAALYLQKPVGLNQFIGALDRVLAPAATAAPKA